MIQLHETKNIFKNQNKIEIKRTVSTHNDIWQKFNQMGNINANFEIRLGPYSNIKDCWKNEPCVIVGTGKSLDLKKINLSRLNGMHTIGVNHIIEKYDKLEWLLFLDDEFIENTNYDLKKFNGKIFTGNRVRLLSMSNVIRFLPLGSQDEISLDITKGLFCRSLSGLCAVHLALITGANPIYLLGLDNPKENKDFENLHCFSDYPSEKKIKDKQKKYESYINANKKHNHFLPFANRIINVCNDGQINTYKKITINEFKKRIKQKIEIKQDPVVCHVHKLRDKSHWNEVSRQIFDNTIGRHIQSCVTDIQQPKADIYLLECIINDNKSYKEFKRVNNSKIISIIHSSGNCSPCLVSDKIVVLNEAWKNKFVNSVVIECAIDMSYYNYDIDYRNKNYGRITRYTSGKVHPDFYKYVDVIKEKISDSQCYMITDAKLNHKNIIYINDVKKDDNKKKAECLSKLSLFVDMHNNFVETFSLSLLEAMAIGLPIILFSEVEQLCMKNVISDAGIICEKKEIFLDTILKFLIDYEMKKEYGMKAKKRALDFSLEKLVNKWNKLFLEVLQ